MFSDLFSPHKKSPFSWGFLRLNRHFLVGFSLSFQHNREVYPLYFIFMNKTCNKCQGKSIQKFWKTDGRQRYKCTGCGYIFRSSRRISIRKKTQDQKLFNSYSLHKQTLAELADVSGVSIKTIHRRLTTLFAERIVTSHGSHHIHLNPSPASYTSSVLILDATFFGRKGSDTQWWLLVAIDGISGDILASKHILQETKEDYDLLLYSLSRALYPSPYFVVIDGRNGVESTIHKYYRDVPVQLCQAHKIATIDRYLLKYPRIESYKVLKEITHGMIHTERSTFLWQLTEFKKQYEDDFRKQELDIRTLKDRYVHPRLRLAYSSLIRNMDQLFVCLDFIQTIRKDHPYLKNPIINTSNRIEWIFSHLKPKVKLHRGLTKERRLSLALSLLWKE